jgi:cytochrome P450
VTGQPASAPAAAAYDPFMTEVVEGDPYPIYRRLRESTPRLWLEQYRAWFFSTFEDVWNLTRTRDLSVERGITPSQLLLATPPNNCMPSQMEPPIHTLYRSALNDLVKPGAARALEAFVRQRARELLAPIRERGGGDMMAEFGSLLAAEVGCHLSGLPRSHARELVRWNNQFFHRERGHRGDSAIGGQAYAEIMAFVAASVADVRAGRLAPAGGLAVMLEMQRNDPTVTEDHVLHTVFNLQIAAGDTVPKAIAASLHRLWESPEQLALLRAAPDLTTAAFVEAVRVDMPTQMQGRTAVAPVPIGDDVIEPGQKAMFMFASANRDEAEFAEPDTYRIDRKVRRHLGFGNDIHRCLGVHVAQMEGRVALEEILAALPNYAIELRTSSHHRTEYLKGWAHLSLTA